MLFFTLFLIYCHLLFYVVYGTMVVIDVLAVVVIVFAVVFGTMVVIVTTVVVIVFAVVFADVGFLYVEPICVFSM